MTPLGNSIVDRVHREFAPDDREPALARLDDVATSAWSFSRERVLRAVLELAAGDPDELDRAVEPASLDWRDVLVAAGDG